GGPSDPGWLAPPERPGRARRVGAGRAGSGGVGVAGRPRPAPVGRRGGVVPRHGPRPPTRAHGVARTPPGWRRGQSERAVTDERRAGGFGALYPVLRAMEEAGHCRRGYFVEGLGGAQFALPGAVDRMRAMAADRADPVQAGPAALPGGQPGWPGAPAEPWSG